MILILLDHEKKEIRRFGIGDSAQSIIRAIQRNEVETIVAGDISNGKVAWEKQFNACDVMPSDFGKRATTAKGERQ